MHKTRVLVANRSRMMRDLVRETLSDQPDIEIVAEAQSESDVIELADLARPDFVIIALEDHKQHLDLCGFLLGRYPQMRVLALSAERGNSVCYWAFIDIRSKCVETSQEGLLNAVRNLPGYAEASN
jgi:DNA-binding NarL/FixJ family response regulator